MSKLYFLVPTGLILFLLSLPLSEGHSQCMAEAGTYTVNDDGGGTFPYVVCFGEDVDVTSDNNFTLPPTGPLPDMVYLFYSCPPTDPDPANDPCWTGWFWTGSDMQTANDGGIVGAIGFNTFLLIAAVIDNNQPNPNGPAIDADGDMCWDINDVDYETWTFLNEIEFDEVNVDDCAGEVTIQITGGYPELFPPAMYSVTNTGPGVISQSGPDGGTITISGLMDGDTYSFTIDDDGNGCSSSFSGGPIDQDVVPPSLSYPPVCEGSSVLPDVASPGGGVFNFVADPGDGATIDPFSGEVFDVLGSYDIEYTVSTGCFPVSTTFTLTVIPLPPPPTMDALYEFCPTDNTNVFPNGIGDYFTLYDSEFSDTPLGQGTAFEFLGYQNPGDPEIEYWVSQTVGDCESETVPFSVVIYGESPPLIDPVIVVCDGESVTLEPISGNDNFSSDFYFYGNAALSNLLWVGESYTFTPTMSTTIYITELNVICETVAEPVDIILEEPPTATFSDPFCYAGNSFYSIIVTTNAANVIADPFGLVTNNNDGTFTISDVPSGSHIDVTLENSAGDCTTLIELPEHDCGCAAPPPPTSGGDVTICAGDPIPALSATVGAGQVVDWYDAATGGTLLATGNTYTPAAAGTYYAETRVLADGCISETRTAITLTITPTPNLVSSMVDCAPNLLTYTVTLQFNNTNSITTNTGTVTNNGGGNFTVSNITVGTNLTYTAIGADPNCTLGPATITSPTCPCPAINPPVATTTVMVCPSDPIPTLTVTVDPGLTADWYDSASGGSQWANNTLSFTPPSIGTYYVEARDPVNNCVSTRIAITISTHPAPSYTLLSTNCAADLLTYEAQLTLTNADQLMVNAGTVMDNGGGSFTVTGIPAGTDLNFTLNNSSTTCSTTDVIISPDCSCAAIMPPMSNGDMSICAGNPIPTLSVTVNAGETVDWYDAPTAGTQLAMNNTSYQPTAAGTYYAETRVLADGCVSSVRTAVTLTINPQPALLSIDTLCAPDLLSYTVTITLTDAASVTVNLGTVTDLGGGVFEVSGIPTGSNLQFNAFNANMSCELGLNVVNSPVCPCPSVADPIPGPVSNICPGDAIPTLSVTVDAGLTADWYDDPVAGSQLASSTLTFTPLTDGTFYVEARDPVNNCVSNRLAITIVTNPDPTYIVNNAVCAMDLLSYSVDLQVTDADQLMVNSGNITDNGGGNFVVDGIPAGTDLIITLTNTTTACSIDDTITAPDCSCGTVDPPISGGDQLICTGTPIPALTATPAVGETVDWYDAPTNGTLLFTGADFTPPGAGTYYAEARVIADDCVSFVRTAVTLTLEPTPTIEVVQADCAPNLLTYTVTLITTDGASVDVNTGTVVNTGGGSFSITDIPAGTDLVYTVFNSTMTCSVGPETVTAPDCSCPLINPPVSGGDQAICEGDPIPSLSVSVGNDETADWYDSAMGGTLLAQDMLSFTPTIAGTYFVEARNTIHNCTSERIAITFTVNPLPSFVLQDTVCAPDLLTYTASIQVSDADQVLPSLGTLVDNGGGNYDIIDIPSGLDLNFTLNNTVTGCSSPGNVPAPDCSCDEVAPPISNGDFEICTGDPIPTISVTVLAGQTADWYDDPVGGTLLADGTDSFTPTAAGTYYAEARVLVNGCVSSERTAVTITLNITPQLVDSEANCAPNLLTYTVVLTLTDAATVNVSNGTVTDNGDGTFSVSGIPAGEDLTYTVFNSDMSCSIGPLMITAPDCSCPMISPPISSGDETICEGDQLPDLVVTLTAGQTADWYDADTGGTLLLMGSDTYTPPAIGTYYVEARDLVNNCISERIAITIIENSVAAPVSLGDQEACASEDTPALAVQAIPNEIVNWYDAETGGTLVANATSSFVPSGPGTYYAEVTSTLNGCTSITRTAVTLTVFDNPVLSVESVTDPGCNDDDGSVSLGASGGQMPYRYTRDGGDFQDSPLFSGLGVDTYTFSTIDDNGCRDDIDQELVAPDAVSASLNVDDEIDCLTSSVTLNGTSSSQGINIVYSWTGPDGQPLPSTGLEATAEEAGIFTLVVTDTVTACAATTTTTVIADLQAPNANAGNADLITCDNENSILSATSSTPGNLTYNWQASEGGDISGDPNQAMITATAGGLYEVLITNLDNGCSQTDTVRVDEIINTDIALNIVANDPSCFGDSDGSIILTAGDPDNILLFAPEGEPFSFNNTFFNLAAGTYNFTVQDEYGCEISTSVTLQQGTDLMLDLGEDIYIKLGDSVTFNPIITPDIGAITSVSWTNGQLLNCDTCLFASTLSSMANTNDFRLTVKDSLGCGATDDIRVYVNRERGVFIPTAFSPDDDGTNDVLFLQGGTDIEAIESFMIFNRWGEIVYERRDIQPNDPSAGWDGTARGGEMLNAAVFVYMIEVRFIDGEVEIFSGDVMLMR